MDIGIRAMQWIRVQCPVQKPKKPLRKVRLASVRANVSHTLLRSVLTDTPMSPRELSKLINRSQNHTETVLKEMAAEGMLKRVPGHPVKYARRAP